MRHAAFFSTGSHATKKPPIGGAFGSGGGAGGAAWPLAGGRVPMRIPRFHWPSLYSYFSSIATTMLVSWPG